VRRVVAGLEHDRVGRGKAGEGVHVGVGVVALEVTVVQPEHAVLAEPPGKLATDRLRVAVRMALAQTAPGAQQGALAVGFNGAAFQSKINALYGTVREDSHVGKAPDQAVVLAGLELAAPAGEAEVEQHRLSLLPACGEKVPRRGG